MSQPDAIIIGTGVIGAAIAFEMSKAGWKTLSLDRNAQAGHGSTAGSCAIIRMHYSTYDGTAFAWEGYHYWRDWADYLGLPAGTPLAQFREIGCLTMKTEATVKTTTVALISTSSSLGRHHGYASPRLRTTTEAKIRPKTPETTERSSVSVSS